MPVFWYKAKGPAQAVIEGEITADDQQAAVTKILHLGQTPVALGLALSQRPDGKEAHVRPLLNRISVPIKTLAYFSRSLSDLLESGVPLVQALELLAKQKVAETLKAAIVGMGRVVRDGGSLSRALEAYPRIFNRLYVSMVRSSEASGNLSRSLLMLSQTLEKEVMVQNRIRSALMYPMIIMGVGVSAIVVLLTFVLPKLSVMFDDLGADLPLPTKIVVGLSDFLVHFGWIVALAVAGLVMYFLKYRSTPKGHAQLSRMLLTMPFAGEFIKVVHIARYARTVAVLLESGVPITLALETSMIVLENAVFIDQARNIAQQVRKGTSLSTAVKSTQVFGDLAANLIGVGEQGGRLESNLIKIATIYEGESQQMTEDSLNVLGPAVLILVVFIVGGMMFAIILPLVKMNMIIK